LFVADTGQLLTSVSYKAQTYRHSLPSAQLNINDIEKRVGTTLSFTATKGDATQIYRVNCWQNSNKSETVKGWISVPK
jgi:hypothetical protein